MAIPAKYPLLEQIDSPAALRSLPENRLPQLAGELRSYLIETVKRSGGHLAANLGTVELTIALHYVFNTPEDRLVWDVGHQSYTHKILTGRRNAMPEIRTRLGPSGFPNRAESEYDAFGVGHSSTSISAALGMAIALANEGRPDHAIAVIGDGALSGGQAFEALNHAGDLGVNLLVILNDNEMSISRNVGALSNYLARLLSGRLYSSVREGSKKVLDNLPPVREFARRAEEHMKGMIVPGTLFEELGFNYIGPVDGHDLSSLVKTLKNVKALSGPQLLHATTCKGKGYEPAENNPCAWHGVSRLKSEQAPSASARSDGPTYTRVFGEWICDMAARDERVIGITPAMKEGSGLVSFAERFPERFFDVGIAEQHSLTLAAGMACEGLKPVVAIYSTFLQRAYDQLIHDIALQNLPVLFAIDRGGLVGPDGPTHAGSFDLSFLRCIPNITIMAPADENECRQMLYTGYLHEGPVAVRYPRGHGPGISVNPEMTALPHGKARLLRKGSRIALLAFGSMLSPAMQAADEIGATLANMRYIKPLDEALVLDLARGHELIVTIEENAIMGGAGSAVNEFLAARDEPVSILNLGLPDRFEGHDSRENLISGCGLDPAGIVNAISERLKVQDCHRQPTRVIS